MASKPPQAISSTGNTLEPPAPAKKPSKDSADVGEYNAIDDANDEDIGML